MGRRRKNPEFDSEKISKALMEAVSNSYNSPWVGEAIPGDSYHKQIKLVAEEFGMSALKIRKLLITSGDYSTPISENVNILYNSGKKITEIQELTGLSRASVHGYLPYSKTIYKTDQISVDAERIRLFRERKTIVEKLTNFINAQLPGTDEILWDALILFAGYPFLTKSGLKFTYTIKGGEMFVSRKDKSITRATINLAFQNALLLDGIVTGPKKLGVFGASYLYPVFIRIGVVKPSTDEQQRADTNS